MTRSRVTLVSVTIGQVTVLTIAVVVGSLAVAPGGQMLAANQGAHEASPPPQSVNTLCDGIDLDAIRRYKPKSRTDAHVEFPVPLSLPVPASLPAITGASGNGKTTFRFSLKGGTPTTCVYRGNGTNAYDFVKCKEAPLPYADPDEDDDDHDDGPSDPLPIAGTIVTADSFTLQINTGDQPVWSRNGRELFYREGDSLMAVPVQIDPFRPSAPRTLFEMPGAIYNLDQFVADYDVSADGRFLAVRQDPRTEIRVVLNWTEEVHRALGRE